MFDRKPEPYAWTCSRCECRNDEEDAPDYGKTLRCRRCGRKVQFGEEIDD